MQQCVLVLADGVDYCPRQEGHMKCSLYPTSLMSEAILINEREKAGKRAKRFARDGLCLCSDA